ncbi:MAG: potassium channel family protein [Clostridiales bacterium]|nr:potassium channel family protein [Clostridiales bacterium]
MKQKRRFYITVITLVCVVYIVLLLLMLYAESGDGQSSIHTFMDALWYSVVTLTTVGYGDITPVTPMGHVIGIIFVLLSTCILITVVSTLVSFLTSEGFPLLILSYHKRKDWYYFADTGQEAYTLAEKIFAEDPRSVIIFGANKNSVDERPEYSCLFVNVSPERLVWIKHGHGNPCKGFLCGKMILA